MSKKKTNQKVNLDLSDQTKSFQERIDEIRSLVEENLRYTKAMRQSGQSKGELQAQKELHKLLQENLKISKELRKMTEKINRWVVWQRVTGVIKILIIIIPIVLGVIYLPPLVKKSIQPLQDVYQEFLGFNQGAQEQSSLIQQISEQFKDNGESPE